MDLIMTTITFNILIALMLFVTSHIPKAIP